MIKIVKTQPMFYYLNKFPTLLKLVSFFGNYLFKFQTRKYNFNNVPVFSEIGIETFNRCNLDCSFCPANKFTDTRIPKLMDPKLFSKIIDELVKINYKGKISLFINNEPLLDKRLETFINEVSTKLPDAVLNIWTNGSLLTKERLHSLYNAGLKNLVIDNYSLKLQILPEIDQVIKSTNQNIIEKMNIKIWLRYKNIKLSNRSGLILNTKNDINHSTKCFYPFYFLNINPEGKVFICCNDTYYRNIVGDINNQSLVQVWKNEQFLNIRKHLINTGRKNLIPCKECNVLKSSTGNI